jgi:hypothetical protein
MPMKVWMSGELISLTARCHRRQVGAEVSRFPNVPNVPIPEIVE